MRSLLLALLLSPILATAATPEFPVLSGRVVDQAKLLSPQTTQALTQQLAAHEQATTDQLVVVTLDSLQGQVIEEFGYQLGRHWGIGQKGKNNGVLLIVAPKERKVRIEVGYGLEGVLTDAISHHIIQSVILPSFKQGDYEAGISNGTTAILLALGGEYKVPKSSKRKQPSGSDTGSDMGWIFFVAIGLGQIMGLFSKQRLLTGLGAAGFAFLLAWALVAIETGIFFALITFVIHMIMGGRTHGGHGGRWGGGGFGGGGFSGGGGGFGGGGSSGGW